MEMIVPMHEFYFEGDPKTDPKINYDYFCQKQVQEERRITLCPQILVAATEAACLRRGSLPCWTLQESRPTVTSSLKRSASLPKNHPENKAGAPCAEPLMRLLIGSPALKFSFKHIVKLFILINIIYTALHLLFTRSNPSLDSGEADNKLKLPSWGALSSDDFLPVVSPLLSVSSCCGVFAGTLLTLPPPPVPPPLMSYTKGHRTISLNPVLIGPLLRHHPPWGFVFLGESNRNFLERILSSGKLHFHSCPLSFFLFSSALS